MTALLLAVGATLIVVALLADRLPALDPRVAGARRASRVAFPGLVEATAAALASGLSLEGAFAEIAPALPAPLDRAARRVATALRLGDPLPTALGALDEVVPAEDVAPFAVVLVAFARAGGRVGRSLDRVAALLRGRLALDEERDALTAQGRASATVLVALAPLGALLFGLALPDHLVTLVERGLGLVALAVVLEVLGAVWLWRIVRSRAGKDDLSTLIDAVVVGLDAGLTFEQSLGALVDRAPGGDPSLLSGLSVGFASGTRGPRAGQGPRLARLTEARRLRADLALGRGEAAFAAFAATGPAEARVAGLVRAATRLGSPLADLLVTQADALRNSERRRAEARARRLPVLMLFPLTFCVLPALLVVFLGPPLLSLAR